jgi:hypothetical protein
MNNSRLFPFAMSRHIGALARFLAAAAVLGLLVFGGGCQRTDVPKIELRAFPAPGRDLNRLEIRAQVSGPLGGLSYKWFSGSGEFAPQVTELPVTTYRFGTEAMRDRVSVEVWLGGKRVAFSDLEVKRPAAIESVTQASGEVQIEITEIPPYDPRGGPNTRADIAGRVSGNVGQDLRVVLYARGNDLWYVQPELLATHPVHIDKSWSSWTHTGSSYAALLVRKSYTPAFTLDVLPRVGGDVLARTIVEGQIRDPSSPPSRELPKPVPTKSLVVPAGASVRVRAGTQTDFKDAAGNVWISEQGFEDGVPLERDPRQPVMNTDTPALYWSERYNVSRFKATLPNGRYLVRLHFAEMYPVIQKAGERVFSFNVEGQEFKDFDIVARAGGSRRAYIESVPVEVQDGELTIAFTRKIQHTVINGIEIIPRAAAER